MGRPLWVILAGTAVGGLIGAWLLLRSDFASDHEDQAGDRAVRDEPAYPHALGKRAGRRPARVVGPTEHVGADTLALIRRWHRVAKEYPQYAVAFPEFQLELLNGRIYRSPNKKPVLIGHVRRGIVLPAKREAGGPGCPGGRWHPIYGGGYVCTSMGFQVTEKPPRLAWRPHAPDVGRAVPYRYAKVTRQDAPLFRRLPSEREMLQMDEAAAGRMAWPGVLQRRMKGVFMLAIDREAESAGWPFYRTVRGQFVLRKDVRFKRPPKMQGEALGSRAHLPLAFVYGKARPKLVLRRGAIRRVGALPKHARFGLRKVVRQGDTQYAVSHRGFAVERSGVRIAKRIKKPKEIPPRDKWVHLNLGEQTFVAYEGSTPVYASLVSSGKKGYSTKPGLFRIIKKYLTTTMDATDPIDGFYRIEEVPWTMYYWRSFAVHGAFWHDDFGQVRSHGCTNVAPKDARWLFQWTAPEVPDGWHARFDRNGTWFYFTE